MKNLEKWQRLEFQGTPVYVMPDEPDWVVPTPAGDGILTALRRKKPASDVITSFMPSLDEDQKLGLIRANQFLELFPIHAESCYPGRDKLLELDKLQECWLHITDRCNLACRHCLFSCSPNKKMTLSLQDIVTIVQDTYDLGTRIFYLTGGEPLVHRDFAEICRLILKDRKDTHLVILTNGILLKDYLEFFKTLPKDRLHFQISVDGPEELHDKLRGKKAFSRLLESISSLSALSAQMTLAMAVHSGNISHMSDVVALASEFSVPEVHYLWLMITGNAGPSAFVPPETIFSHLMDAQAMAKRLGIVIDNIQAMESQVFSTSGTKYDLGNAGWESVAVGPDGSIYPTPALIGQKAACCGHVNDGVEAVWEKSPTLNALRALSLITDDAYSKNPLKFIVGGGDIDHSFYAGGSFLGHDPYVALYNQMALWLIHRAAESSPASAYPQIRLKMGDRLLFCDHSGKEVALSHSNCVLSLSGTHKVVGDFYDNAADALNKEITNPVCYPENEISHIPQTSRARSYGCGSPVLDAELKAGETMVDLGSGAGVECFIASKKVGRDGRIFGIDMLDNMLNRADTALNQVSENIGYRNVEFKKGYLEAIPLSYETADVVISNCVINLSEDKSRTLSEIHRILKPGGRTVISDVVTDTPPPPSIKNDARFRGECIAGAMVQPRLMATLEATGFQNIRMLKRFFYRDVNGHRFYSLTFRASKPAKNTPQPAVYPGPFAGVITDAGKLLLRGHPAQIDLSDNEDLQNALFVLDNEGNAANIDAENSCGCYSSPTVTVAGATKPSVIRLVPSPDSTLQKTGPDRIMSDCMHCGRPLVYLKQDAEKTCVFCGNTFVANAVCEKGHFVCDACHSSDAFEMVKRICIHSGKTDMIDMLSDIRCHPSMPLHGPEHHFAVPGIMVSTYRNLGGHVNDQDIIAAIERGKSVPGGTCGFWGGCGAALGVGIGFSIILKSNPLRGKERKIVQRITGEIIKKISKLEAARCCQRESWTALIKAAELSREYLPIPLKAAGSVICTQMKRNRECAGNECPYFVKRESRHSPT